MFMSLYRQLLIAIFLSSLMALIGSITSSTLSTRDYILEQLRVKNQDNASSLALSLSMAAQDALKVELAMAAQFDSGNYKLVRFTDPNDKIILEKKAPDQSTGSPLWFSALLPMEIPQGNAKVASGWTQIGTVTLESQSSYAYESLWKSTMRMTLTMTLTALLGMMLGYFIILRLKKPLNQVVNQAQAITLKRFITIPEPKVPELRRLANAMNLTVKRLREMFAEEGKRLEIFRKEANFDGVSNLPIRQSFITQLQESLHTEETIFGYCMILRINNLDGVNKKAGRKLLDAAIEAIGKSILMHSDKMQDSLSGRLNGSDFALLITNDKPLDTAKSIMKVVVDHLGGYSKKGDCAIMGLGRYKKNVVLGELLGGIDKALAEAKAKTNNAIVVVKEEAEQNIPKTSQGWSAHITKAIKERGFKQLSYPVGDFKKKIIHREGPLRMRSLVENAWIMAGKFFPIADRLKLTPKIDLVAVRLGLDHIRTNPVITRPDGTKKTYSAMPGFAVNISSVSLGSRSFVGELKKLLSQHPNEANRMWLEVPEAGAFKNIKQFRLLIQTLKPLGVKVGIKHFGRQFDQIHHLHDMGADYLKVDAIFIRGIEKNQGNQSFLKGLVQMAHGIDMLAIAEGVLTPEEVNVLKGLQFDAMTGPAVKE